MEPQNTKRRRLTLFDTVVLSGAAVNVIVVLSLVLNWLING